MQQLVLGFRKFDVFHPSYYDSYFLESLDGKPFVLTVVDMIPEVLPECFASSPHKDKQLLIPKAAAIIAISNATKRDVLKYHDIPSERVFVVPLGAPTEGSWQGTPPPLPDDYVLFVGNRGGYKNFDRFAAAMRTIMVRRPSLHLVCAGGRPLGDEEAAPFLDAGCLDRVIVTRPSEDELAWLYRKARLFVFPSLYEGFGLPVLEAFTYRCPAALSTADSLREVVDEAALFFDPSSIDSMTEKIERLLDDADLRAVLTAAGGRRARDFSWRRMAQQTAQIYSTAASHSRHRA